MLTQQELYLYNRQRIQDPCGHRLSYLNFEQEWVASRLWECGDAEPVTGVEDLLRRCAALVEAEKAAPPPSAEYVADHMTLDEFQVLVQEFAVDGLTEAQVFYYVLPRLSLEAQMPMLRILIDEFGSGNLRRAHTSLYVALLRELGMPVALEHYVARIESTSFEFVNLFFWLTLRADDPSYFAGAITYLETVIPDFFDCYERACQRLGIEAHAYYSEHRHIDLFHAREGRRLLRAMFTTETLDAGKAWDGIRLASRITALAFDGAVDKSRTLPPTRRFFVREVADESVG